MATYKCDKCQLLGSGIPKNSFCPNCKSELYIKIRSTGENILDGDYLTVDEAKAEILHIVETFDHTKCKLYVSWDVANFLERFFPEHKHNYIIDTHLSNFSMNVR